MTCSLSCLTATSFFPPYSLRFFWVVALHNDPPQWVSSGLLVVSLNSLARRHLPLCKQIHCVGIVAKLVRVRAFTYCLRSFLLNCYFIVYIQTTSPVTFAYWLHARLWLNANGLLLVLMSFLERTHVPLCGQGRATGFSVVVVASANEMHSTDARQKNEQATGVMNFWLYWLACLVKLKAAVSWMC